MDVPYDPACPLVVDSDEESIEDEILGRKGQQEIGIFSSPDLIVGNSSRDLQSGKKSPHGFEDDNEELLDYCLRESGFLSDDDFKTETVTTDTQKTQDVGYRNEDEASNEKKHKKKKKREKSKHEDGHKKKRKRSESSSDSDEEENKRRHSKSKDQKNSLHKDRTKESKASKILKDKKHRRKSHKSADEKSVESEDEVDMLAFKDLEEEKDAFPLSKMDESKPNDKERKIKKSLSGDDEKKRHKDRSRKDSSKDRKSRDKKKESDSKQVSKDKKKRKRKRSKSSHKETKDSDVEPENKKKKKNKHREKSKERTKSKERDSKERKSIKEKDEKKKHEKRNKDDSKGDREKSHKKKKREKKDEEERLSSKIKESKRTSSTSDHSHHKKHHVERSSSDKSAHKDIESKGKTKTGHEKHERRPSEKTEKKPKEVVEEKEKSKKQSSKEEKLIKSSEKGKHNMFDSTSSISESIKKEKMDNTETERKQQQNEEAAVEDTDSEFERLSDQEKDSDDEDNIANAKESDHKPHIEEGNSKDSTRSDDESEKEKQIQKKDSFEEKDKDVSMEADVDDEGEQTTQEEELAELVTLEVKDTHNTSSDGSTMKTSDADTNSDENKELLSETQKDMSSMNIVNGEKRPFKIFSKEETDKLHKELLSKDENSVVENDESSNGEVVELKEVADDDASEKQMAIEKETKIVLDDELQRSKKEIDFEDEAEIVSKQEKPNDDLFDDIFSKEDSENKENDGLAKMLGKEEDTSPKRSSFKKQIHTPGSDKKHKEELDLKKGDSIIRKTPKLKMEDGKYEGRKTKSPSEKKLKSPNEKKMKIETVIPGLEPVSIPGLEINSLRKESTERKSETKAPSKIPLLFDDDAPAQKQSAPKTPEFSPSKEKEMKKKQPYTPPEEFTGAAEMEGNQFDRYYHLEADDSPYNPEELTLMDIGLSPVDVNNIQKDALKGAVEMRLKEPFSGFENPTWQKIIEAKSRHEVKRHGRKSHEKHGHERSKKFSKPSSSKQQNMVSMLVRQSRVEQECKEVLKLYYKSKEITKDEYKTILRKAVPQVTMSNSPIIPEKIRSLMKKFVCKCKGQRLMSGDNVSKRPKSKSHSASSFSQSLTFPGEKRFRYLNPDLPMPPL